jgi:ABC-type dipeptide/oligopeptide/nickel transport system permease component
MASIKKNSRTDERMMPVMTARTVFRKFFMGFLLIVIFRVAPGSLSSFNQLVFFDK